MNIHREDLLGSFRGDLFYIHTARGRGDQSDPPALAVQREGQINLTLDVRARLDVHMLDGQPLGARLLGNQMSAEHALRSRADSIQIARDLDAAGLAASARMNLR